MAEFDDWTDDLSDDSEEGDKTIDDALDIDEEDEIDLELPQCKN